MFPIKLIWLKILLFGQPLEGGGGGHASLFASRLSLMTNVKNKDILILRGPAALGKETTTKSWM